MEGLDDLKVDVRDLTVYSQCPAEAMCYSFNRTRQIVIILINLLLICSIVILIVLFCSRRTQRRGMHDLKVWPGVEADGQKTTTTPGKSTSGEDQMSRLAKVHGKIITSWRQLVWWNYSQLCILYFILLQISYLFLKIYLTIFIYS